jgi:cytochrome c biogenesis protein CcmG/thiol:disulfide interchange protein DsbE
VTEFPGRREPLGRRRSRALLVARAAAILLLGVLLAVLVWSVIQPSSGAGLVAAVKRGEQPRAPEFDLPVIWNRQATWPSRARPALADERVVLAELEGTPVVLNFWASWCIPCRKEAPDLAAAARAHRDQLAFLAINVRDLVPDARRFLEELDVPFPSVRDGSERTLSPYGLTGLPQTYYIDARGRIAGRAVGALSRAELERGIAPLLREQP